MISSIPISDRARHRWRSILPLFGVDSKFLTKKKGPCPICGGKDRFHFDDIDGAGTWFCNTENVGGNGFKLIMLKNNWDFPQAAKHVEAHLGDAPVNPASPKKRDEAKTREHMNAAWRGARPIGPESAAGRYLQARIGPGPYPSDLRAHGGLFCKGEDDQRSTNRPALLAMVRASDGSPATVHRTYLTEAGAKADMSSPRRVMSATPAGCAVRLSPVAATLGIAEGLETALSATALTGTPCWSALNAGLLERWIPPSGVEHVVIFGDCDASMVGQRASYALGERLVRQGVGVEIRIAPGEGLDWADVWAVERGKGRAA